ncbi:bacterial alpha-L-rhamnosidase-domain-containing protein [Aspergillus egyptiacus]|nr:bacterial alpha-L-rhamnosidase-domain-containing protein [Aspergillus egyptiacus]
MLPHGSINPGEMTSFNHYRLGCVINWLHSAMAGVSPLYPAWQDIKVQPIPGGTIDSAEAAYETPYGRLECRWAIRVADNLLALHPLVPPNSRALVTLPSDDGTEGPGKNLGSDQDFITSRYTLTRINIAGTGRRSPGCHSYDFRRQRLLPKLPRFSESFDDDYGHQKAREWYAVVTSV